MKDMVQRIKLHLPVITYCCTSVYGTELYQVCVYAKLRRFFSGYANVFDWLVMKIQ